MEWTAGLHLCGVLMLTLGEPVDKPCTSAYTFCITRKLLAVSWSSRKRDCTSCTSGTCCPAIVTGSEEVMVPESACRILYCYMGIFSSCSGALPTLTCSVPGSFNGYCAAASLECGVAVSSAVGLNPKSSFGPTSIYKPLLLTCALVSPL